MADTIDQMLSNAQADSWSDVRGGDEEYIFDDETAPSLERAKSYVDYCFDTYPVVSNHLDREQVQVCIADWDRRRGQARYNTRMSEEKFGKRVADSTHRQYANNKHALFIATALVGVKPEDDKGVGWKPCIRHELGHLIDYEKRGTSGHGHKFKSVMRQFGEVENDGQHAHGWAPRVHR